jgi:hypothetical protein
MPAYQEEVPPAVPRIYWKVVGGEFVSRDDSGTDIKANAIEGIFRGVHVRDDPGNAAAKVAAGKKVGVRIEDGDLHIIDFRPHICYASSFASRLGTLVPGETIKITAVPGRDPKVTFCHILRPTGEGTWTEVPYSRIDSKDEKEREKLVLDVIFNYNMALGLEPATDLPAAA